VVAGLQFQTSDVQPCFFLDLATESRLFTFLPACYAAGKGKAASVVATDHQEIRSLTNDPNRSAQRSENRECSVESETGTGNEPEKTPFQVLRKGAQAGSLARDPGEFERDGNVKRPASYGCGPSLFAAKGWLLAVQQNRFITDRNGVSR
jgi:hypothetical protein